MIFSPLDENRTFFRHLDKKTAVICFFILSSITVWSILIQTALKVPDEKIQHTLSEPQPIEFAVDFTYVKQFAKDSEEAKIERLYSQFNDTLSADGSHIFINISRDSNKNPKNN